LLCGFKALFISYFFVTFRALSYRWRTNSAQDQGLMWPLPF